MLNLSHGLKISPRKWDIPPANQKHITIGDTRVYRPTSRAILPERAYEMQHIVIFLFFFKIQQKLKAAKKRFFFLLLLLFRANIQQNSLDV